MEIYKDYEDYSVLRRKHNGIKYAFFLDGIFSNWYPCSIVVDSIKYNCIEQYMMYSKALTFGDKENAEKILKEYSPRIQKKIGREINNFNEVIWDSCKYNIVKKGLIEKFKQNSELREYLLSYKGFSIIEASPVDRIWGIGYSSNDAISNINNWGENLLGKILTELSNEM